MKPIGRPREKAKKRRIAVGLACLFMLNLTCTIPVYAVNDSKDLAQLENRFFDHPYASESTEARLTRLEKMVFGESRTGSNDERLKNLLAATASSDSSSSDTASNSTTNSPASAGSANNSSSSNASTTTASNDARGGTDSGDVGSYPRVDRLEQTILGKTFKKESIESRLNRLEQKAFGAPTTIEDLSDRTDRLAEYATAKFPDFSPIATPGGGSSGSNWRPSVPTRPMGNFSVPATFGAGRAQMPMDQMVSAMEQKVFGKSEAGQSLTKRVTELEKNVYPSQKQPSDESLAERVNKLAASLQMNVMQPPAAVSSGSYGMGQRPFGGYTSTDGPNAYNDPNGGIQPFTPQQTYGVSNSYGQQASNPDPLDDDGQMQQATNGTGLQDSGDIAQTKTKTKGSFLGGLAKALVGIGSVAGALGGGIGSMGMYGGYGGYGGYGMPYGGGYGMPYGSMYGSPYGYGSGYGGMGGFGGMNMYNNPYGGMMRPGFGGMSNFGRIWP